MTTSSTEKLVRALREAGASVDLVKRAQSGEFHDYESPHAFPQHALLLAARAEGLTGIVQATIDGEFDATLEESQIWAASPEGQAVFAELHRGHR